MFERKNSLTINQSTLDHCICGGGRLTDTRVVQQSLIVKLL